jgi:hypothetical protein
MTVERLCEILEEMMEQGKGNYEVKVLTQPDYPLMYKVRKVGTRIEGDCESEDEVLYIATRQSNEYGHDFDEIEGV